MSNAVLEPGRGAGMRGEFGRHGDAALDGVRSKIARGERLSIEDGETLFATPDIWSVCEMADAVRRRLHGDVAYYNINRHLNYSNVCALSCKFCEFYRKKDEPGSYTRDMEYVKEQVRQAVEGGATEIHSVGGLHPYLPFSYYTDLCSTIRDEARRLGSELHVKAFTAVEVVHLARIAKVYKGGSGSPSRSGSGGEAGPGSENRGTQEGQAARREGIRWVLERLKEAGLGSLPGGGAEVFDDRVHDEAYKGKIRSDVWLDVHHVAHELGLNTNATILYGHIEQRRERLVHMDMLRRAQDEAMAMRSAECRVPSAEEIGAGSSLGTRHSELRTGAFQTIIPLPFFPDGSELEYLPGPGGLENLRTLAIARLMLDNFPHVKAFWIMQTLPMSQLMLQSGADDIDGTIVWYDITKVGGASTHQEVTVGKLCKAIRDAGFRPVERDTLYRRVVREAGDGRKWRVEGTVA